MSELIERLNKTANDPDLPPEVTREIEQAIQALSDKDKRIAELHNEVYSLEQRLAYESTGTNT